VSKPILVSTTEFFKEAVDDAFEQRKLDTFPLARHYIVKTETLFDQESENGKKSHQTLAEMFLTANTPEKAPIRNDLLKKLGDTSLYVSGFFGDSLQRKLVDIDYYANMGELAYGSLSETVKEDHYKRVYEEFSLRFMNFVEILTLISQKMMVQSNENLLRLYENYLRTGSELAKDTLIEKGIHLAPNNKTGGFNQ